MKHIERKFLFQEKKKGSNLEKLIESSNIEHLSVIDYKHQNKNKLHKNSIIFAETENGYIFPIIGQKIDGEIYSIPMPDPTLIYFNNAQSSLRLIKKLRKDLKLKLADDNIESEPAKNEIYHYFGNTSQFVIFLFTSIESFVNQIIPVNYIYRKQQNRKTEIYNSEQIQRYLSFNEKLKEVLPDCTKKNFFGKQTPTTQHIDNLKLFRDEIVHTKKDTKNSKLFYDSIVSKSLNFKFEKTIRAVQKFMNYYRPEYVVECNCGEDF